MAKSAVGCGFRAIVNSNCKKNIILFILVCSFIRLYSQSSSDLKNDSILKSQKDIVDVYKEIFNKKSSTKKDTLKNKKDYYFSVLPAVGYAMSTGLTGVVASNISFKMDTNVDKFSSISASAYYTVYKQYWLLLNSYITDDDSKLNYIGDWRIYNFPTNTFGLGGSNSISDALRVDFAYLKFHEVVSHEIIPSFFVGMGYQLDYHWAVKAATNPEDVYNQIMEYGLKKHSTTSGISVNAMYDNRENPVNPSSGIFASVQLRNNLKATGSEYNSESLLIDLRKYFKMPFNSVLAFWSYNELTTSGKLPYLDLPSNGWDAYNNTGRGYVQGRFRGNNFIDLEGEYRFKLINNGLIGGVVFANAESFSDYPSNKFNTIVFAKGIGLRIKINKHSKTNLCFDYAFGQGQSHGMFLNVGEVF